MNHGKSQNFIPTNSFFHGEKLWAKSTPPLKGLKVIIWILKSHFHLCHRCDTKSSESDDYSYSDDETVNDTSTRHFLPGPNGFKISGQKIQIYSDGSVTATDAGTHDHNGLPDDNIRAYSLTESESDKESEYSN